MMSPRAKAFNFFCHQQTNRIKQRFIRKELQQAGLTVRGKRSKYELPDGDARDLHMTLRGNCR